MKKRLLNTLKWTAIYSVVTLLFLEILLRILGYRPYSNDDYKVSSTPSKPYVADNEFGIRLNEGVFTLTLNNAVKFTATHQSNGERKTPGSVKSDAPEILFLGCSFTYGYGVNDEETFPAIIQKKHEYWSIRNAAVVGYGTTQHLLQLRERLDKNPPECVILSLSSVHLMRTVLSRRYRSNLRIGYRRSSGEVDDRMKGARFPYMTECGKVEYQEWESMYPEIWGRYWLATSNFLQMRYDQMQEPDCDPVEITACILTEMRELCEKKGVKFGVICLDSNHETAAVKEKVPEIPWKNVGFSFKSKRFTHLPHDSHPNQKGHRKIARTILPFTEKLMNDE